MTTLVKQIMQEVLNSEVHLHTTNGYGSTNTKIRRWTTAITNTGSDITYADSATLGGTFTINTNGIYAISYSDQFNAVGNHGISLNSSELTTPINHLITTTDALIQTTSAGSGYRVGVSITLSLVATDVIRAHAAGETSGTNNSRARFQILRIG